MHSALNFRSQTQQIHYNLKSMVSATNCPHCSNRAPYLCPDFPSIQFPATAVLKPYLKDKKSPITRKHPSLIRHFQLFWTLLVLSAQLRKFPKQFLHSFAYTHTYIYIYSRTEPSLKDFSVLNKLMTSVLSSSFLTQHLLFLYIYTALSIPLQHFSFSGWNQWSLS